MHPSPSCSVDGCLQGDSLFRRMLGLENKEVLALADITKVARWRKVEPLVKSFIGNTLHLLGG